MTQSHQQENPDIIFGGAELRRRLDVSDMSVWRWVDKGIFPPPDLRINGRKYWREETYTKWVEAQAEAEAVRRDSENV
jgi:predicted DNA-binding transcriptional regulator AlpA